MQGYLLPDWVQQAIALLLQIFYDGAKIDRLIRKSPILGNLGLIDHLEPIALKQFDAPSAVEGYHLGVDLPDTVVVQMA